MDEMTTRSRKCRTCDKPSVNPLGGFCEECQPCWNLGFDEGLGDMGMTYDDDPESPRSVAYDLGRTVRRKAAGLERA